MRQPATSENKIITQIGACTPNNTTVTHRLINEDDAFGNNGSLGLQSKEGNDGLRAKITWGLVTALTTKGFVSLSTRQAGGGMAEALYLDDAQNVTLRAALTIAGHTMRSAETGITASTTQAQGQRPLTKDQNVVSTVANANDVVTMPVAVAGMTIRIKNGGANVLQIFPASGDNINGAGVNTSVTLAAGASVLYWTADTTNWNV